MKYVDEVIELSEIGQARVMTGSWDFVYSLSNDLPSASLATLASAKVRTIGYHMQDGTLKATNDAAERWLEMAAFDRVKRLNTETYQRRMLAIVGAPEAPIPPPALTITGDQKAAAFARISSLFKAASRPLVAINVGAGGRWPKKMLTAGQIHQYAQLLLQRNDVDLLLVGGAAEAEKAAAIMTLCGTNPHIQLALTGSSVREFVAILNEVDVLVCGDTLAMHVASAIDLPTVAVFGPTSPAEIADFQGLITKTWTQHLDCLACYGDCAKQENCMSLLDLPHLVSLTEMQLSRRQRAILHH
jgi:ADP-heptose:LPS heptosyltransferase